jgi:Predicted nucleotide-binding protein containing TIR-like domain
MKIFIASSTENLDLLREIEAWIQECGHEPYPWDKPGLFPPGHQTFLSLIEISKEVEAAIFLFGNEDKVWYRGDAVAQPRDNVLIEYGLFAGQLGPLKAIICTHGNPKTAVDLHGITTIDLAGKRRGRGRLELGIWARRLNSTPVDPEYLRYAAQVHDLEQKVSTLSHRVAFEADKSADLERILQEKNIVDFRQVALNEEGHWKLLYDFDYFEGASWILANRVSSPAQLRMLLVGANSKEIADRLSWHAVSDPTRTVIDQNPQRNISLSRKALRVFRQYSEPKQYSTFLMAIEPSLRAKLNELANSVLSQRQD